MSIEDKVRVLFVCMGNICRSPTAHGVFRDLVTQRNLHKLIQIDSAGTHAYHVGEPPDRRAQSTASQRGIDLSDLRARPVNDVDFDTSAMTVHCSLHSFDLSHLLGYMHL